MSVSRQSLFLFAILLWLFGGYKVLSIGFEAWGIVASNYKYLWFFVALAFFMGLVFPKVVKSNTKFILSLEGESFPCYRCMKPSSWLVMGVMMTFGIVFRRLNLAGDTFISGFYIGLGISLIGVPIYFYGREILKLRKQTKSN